MTQAAATRHGIIRHDPGSASQSSSCAIITMFGNAAKGVVLRRRTGDWHMYVISAFAGVVGGFYIWLEPLRELQMNSLAKDAAEAKAAKEDKK